MLNLAIALFFLRSIFLKPVVL